MPPRLLAIFVLLLALIAHPGRPALAAAGGDHAQSCEGCSDDGTVVSCKRCERRDGSWNAKVAPFSYDRCSFRNVCTTTDAFRAGSSGGSRKGVEHCR